MQSKSRRRSMRGLCHSKQRARGLGQDLPPTQRPVRYVFVLASFSRLLLLRFSLCAGVRSRLWPTPIMSGQRATPPTVAVWGPA